jgi:hypothetical protein
LSMFGPLLTACIFASLDRPRRLDGNLIRDPGWDLHRT